MLALVLMGCFRIKPSLGYTGCVDVCTHRKENDGGTALITDSRKKALVETEDRVVES